MKTRKYKYMLLAGLMVLATSCVDTLVDTKDTETDSSLRKMVFETITASVDTDTKATVNADARFSWKVGDHIAVHVSGTNDERYVFSSDEGCSGASANGATASFSIGYESGYSRDAFAVYPSTIVDTNATFYGQTGTGLAITLPSEYTLDQVSGTNTPCPMIADNTGNSWTFRHICGLLRLTINDIPTGTSYLKVDFNGRKVCGDFTIPKTVIPGESTVTTTSNFDPGVNDYIIITGITDQTSVDVNIPLPTGSDYRDLIVSAWNENDVALKASILPFTYTPSRAKGKKETVDLKPGIFPIGEKKYALFSPSNLRAVYNSIFGIADWTFQFYTYEYQPVGNAPGNTILTDTPPYINTTGYETVSVSVDLFGWVGHTSSFPGWAMNGITSSKDNLSYSSVANDWLKDEWGLMPITYEDKENKTIINYCGGTWRTPTKEEWEYFSAYYQYQGKDRMGCATVNGHACVFFLPLDWVFPDHFDGYLITGTQEGFATNELYYHHWAPLSRNGALFLQAAGYRSGTEVYNVNEDGAYWSMTAYPVSISPLKSYAFQISSAGIDPLPVIRRDYGLSVRLIRPL